MLSSEYQISKDEIAACQFVSEEVLCTEGERLRRKMALEKAMILGNAYHNKVNIIFETVQGVRSIQTTIWACLERGVSLKGGIFIPLKCIRQIELI